MNNTPRYNLLWKKKIGTFFLVVINFSDQYLMLLHLHNNVCHGWKTITGENQKMKKVVMMLVNHSQLQCLNKTVLSGEAATIAFNGCCTITRENLSVSDAAIWKHGTGDLTCIQQKRISNVFPNQCLHFLVALSTFKLLCLNLSIFFNYVTDLYQSINC